METRIALIALPEMMIALIVLGWIAWIVWTVWEYIQASKNAAWDQAWRVVLDDPHYIERRHFEERKRVEEDAHKRNANLKSTLVRL
jgi:Tfp pilus assembly protein PilE